MILCQPILHGKGILFPVGGLPSSAGYSYLIVYRHSDPLRIVRLIHTKRDVKKLLKRH